MVALLKPGDAVAEFEIVRHLARGGMGSVYVARQRATGALRALKVLHPFLGSDPRLQERFEQEARVGASVPSDHVVQVLAAGVDPISGHAWLAMELLEGMDLATYLASRVRLAPLEVIEILSQVGHALSAAHGVGIVHRDLKPENVYLATRRMVGVPYIVKLLDFGIAKLVSESTRATAALGTPAYMAPEQAHGSGSVSRATDVWAFGILAFEMLTGADFWRGAANGSPAELLREVLVDPIPLASERAAEELAADAIPPSFDGWLARCVARNPSDRFPSIDLALSELRASLGIATVTTDAPVAHVSLPGAPPARTVSVDSTVPRAGEPVSLPGAAARKALRVVYRERFGRTIVPAFPGSTLLEVSIDNDVTHQRVCGGKARCTTCRVYVHEGAAMLEARTDAEARVAAQRGWVPEIRLACQAKIRADAKGEIAIRRLVLDREDVESAQTGTGEETRLVERHATVLCVRLDGLASFAARHLPYDAMHVTARAFRSLSDLVRAHRGEVLAVHGARLAASFGSRVEDQPRAAMDAVRAAVRMQARLASINDYVGRNFGEAFTISIGASAGAIFSGELHEGDLRMHALLGETLELAEAVADRASASGVSFAATPEAIAPIRAQLALGEPLGAVATSARAADAVAIAGFLKPDVTFLVQTSFEKVSADADAFARLFYERLFTIAPEAKPLFAHVDMDKQRKMLIDVLAIAVRGLDDMDAIVPTLRELGRRHVGYGAKTKHYRFVGEALLWAMERQLGEDLTPELHLAWMEVYGAIARTMIEAARSQTQAGAA